LREKPSRTPVCRPSVSTDNLAFPNCANHRSLSRPPSRRQPFQRRSLKTKEGRRSGNRAGPPQKCHQDLTVLWCSLCAAAEAMTPCTRGVSDLGCGRGHDRRRGQISWSLTPRSPRWRGDDRDDGEPSATHADRVLGTRSLRRTSTCSGRQKSVMAGWRESDRRGTSWERGNTPRWALFPSLFPLARCHVFGFAILSPGFSAAPNLRPGTSSAVMAPSFSVPNRLVDLLGQSPLGSDRGVQILPSFWRSGCAFIAPRHAGIRQTTAQSP
jgi:hypothetical protein